MLRPARSDRVLRFVLLGLAAILLLSISQMNAADGPASQPAKSAQTQTKIEELEAYYAKLYGAPLESSERLPREIAIISLSRIDAPDILQRLLEASKPKDRDPIVAYLAWEALHARHGSMNAEQRRQWAVAGVRSALGGAFPGATAAPVLRALTEQPPTIFEGDAAKLAVRVIQENDTEDSAGRAALDALADLVAAWHDPVMIRSLVASLGHAGWAGRISYALRKLPDAPDNADAKKASALWRGWPAQHASLKAAAPEELKAYTGASTIFPKPDRITDPEDKRWHKELEIPKLTVSDFDLVWCIDSTGSMNEENQIVAAETAPVIRACSLISRRARCGVVYYRHETEAALMKPCCTRAGNDPRFYQVKGYPLTTDARSLASKMAAEPIPKPDRALGNVHPGSAVHAAMKAAMGEMNWSTDKNSRRVIILVGDAPVTPGSEKACEELGALAKSRGYLVHALARPRAKESWDPMIRSSGGTFTTFAPGARAGARIGSDPANGLADIMANVVGESVTRDYHDRATPLVKILIAYAKAAELAEHHPAAK